MCGASRCRRALSTARRSQTICQIVPACCLTTLGTLHPQLALACISGLTLDVHHLGPHRSAVFAHWQRGILLAVIAGLVIHCPHLWFTSELEGEGRKKRLSAWQASCSNAGRSDAHNRSRLHWQIDLGVFDKARLRPAMITRGHSVKRSRHVLM